MEFETSIYCLNESAITIDFGNQIDLEIWNRVQTLNKLLKLHPFPGFESTIPAYSSLTVIYNPEIVFNRSPFPGKGAFEKVHSYLKNLIQKDLIPEDSSPEVKIIPVWYGGEWGPDLGFLSSFHSLKESEIIKLHTEAIYKVFMIGFVPGFAYLGGLHKKLESPRKKIPRKSILPGSVGIAGMQTGIYPLNSPGGWNIIGRTPLLLFDPYRNPPSWLKTGDEVKFRGIGKEEYEKISGKGI